MVVAGDSDVTPQQSDAAALLTLFTIRAYLEKRRETRLRRRRLYIVAEILDSENVGHALTAGADEVIESRKVGYSLLAHSVRHHGTAAAMSRVVLQGDQNAYIGSVPEAYPLPRPYGDLLRAIRLSDQGALVIGVRTLEGWEHINPPNDTIVAKGSTLIYLAPEAILEPS